MTVTARAKDYIDYLANNTDIEIDVNALSEDALDSDVVLIAPRVEHESYVLWFDDGENTMICLGDESEQTFKMATWGWIEHAVRTVYAGGYRMPDIDALLNWCVTCRDVDGSTWRTKGIGGQGLTDEERAEITGRPVIDGRVQD